MVTYWSPEELTDMARYDAEVDAMRCYMPSATKKATRSGESQATQSHRNACKKWREKKLAERQGHKKATTRLASE